MKELELELNGKADMVGFKMKQIGITPFGYCYQTTDEFGKVSYEVFERKIQKENDTIISGQPVHYDAKVLYPTTKDFGRTAFCFHKREDALNRLSEFKEKEVKNGLGQHQR